jgi:hypothetical protein
MKILFYSNKCEYSKKILLYLEKNNIKDVFKMINVDNIKLPDDIKVVPTIIDTDLNEVMEGKKAFEYLSNIKYFNNPTNNIDYISKLPENPKIEEDKLASKIKIGLELKDVNMDVPQQITPKIEIKSNIVETKPPIQITKKNILMQFRR